MDTSLRQPGASSVIYGGVDAAAVSFHGVAEALAEPGALPAIFHCAAGKDRTGWVSALLQLLVFARETSLRMLTGIKFRIPRRLFPLPSPSPQMWNTQ